MGGLLILSSALIPTLLWADLQNPYVWIAVLVDARLRRGRLRGRLPEDRPPLPSWPAAALQDGRTDSRRAAVGGALLVLAEQTPTPLYNTRLIFPFFKNLIPDLGFMYLPFAAFILVAWSNAVNLTDGLDGLAISTFGVAAAAFTGLAYVTGHARLGAPRTSFASREPAS